MTRSRPFRADHIGSLVRPPELLRARDRHAACARVVEVARRVWGYLTPP
jgi:methionine synthase II (cobalamin-independent)